MHLNTDELDQLEECCVCIHRIDQINQGSRLTLTQINEVEVIKNRVMSVILKAYIKQHGDVVT